MSWLITLLRGKKTYLAAIGAALAVGALQMGWIDQSQFEAALALTGAGAVIGFRAAMKK